MLGIKTVLILYIHVVILFSIKSFCRLDAIEDLMSRRSLVSEARDILRTLPDLERLLRKYERPTIDFELQYSSTCLHVYLLLHTAMYISNHSTTLLPNLTTHPTTCLFTRPIHPSP